MQETKKIKIDVYFSPANLDELQLKDKTVVIIDVLRASTSIITAMKNGAKEIIPVKDIESAVKVSSSLFGDVTLRAGERNSKRIEGFNLGNSPREYREEVVKGKSIIFVTTNGSVAIAKGRHAKNLVVAGFVNVSAVTDFLANLREDFIILCAGNENEFCIEDAICAGRIINKLDNAIDDELVLDDASVAAVALDKTFGKNILRLLKTSEHGKYLIDVGFSEDQAVCAAIDSIPVLPYLVGNVLRDQKTVLKRSA
jgi:2-phosphosulfolactate phosphatase